MTRPFLSLRNYRSFLLINIQQLYRLQSPSSLTKWSKLQGYMSNFQSGMKIMGLFCFKECSPIFAQRVFRTYNVLQLHSKLWSNRFNTLRALRVLNLARTRPLSNKALLSFLLVSLCQPDQGQKVGESIPMAELTEHENDLDFIHELTSATVVCPNCKERLVVDKRVPNVKYCHCPDSKSAYDKKIKGYAWTPFVETADLLIWRMPHPDRPGLFMYKVYGYYNDISPEDFLNTQLDIEYRRKWDDTVLKLEIVESNKEINQDVIYWEMKWPTMFSNRDYLFARRHLVDTDKKTMVIISKSVPHPSVPDKKGVHRVKEYWSVMQVNAVKDLSQPGVEFGLTYFDNPGVSLPQWLNNWAAMTAIPDFLDKQRNAARAKKKAMGHTTKSLSHFSETQPAQDCNNNSNQKIQDTGLTSQSQETSSNSNPILNSPSGTNSNSTTPAVVSAPNSEILSQFFKEHYVLDAQ